MCLPRSVSGVGCQLHDPSNWSSLRYPNPVMFSYIICTHQNVGTQYEPHKAINSNVKYIMGIIPPHKYLNRNKRKHVNVVNYVNNIQPGFFSLKITVENKCVLKQVCIYLFMCIYIITLCACVIIRHVVFTEPRKSSQ